MDVLHSSPSLNPRTGKLLCPYGEQHPSSQPAYLVWCVLHPGSWGPIPEFWATPSPAQPPRTFWWCDPASSRCWWQWSSLWACPWHVHSVKEVLGLSLEGGREITFLTKLTARTFTHLNKQPSMPNITLVYRKMSVVELKHCFKRFPVGGAWQRRWRRVLLGWADKCSQCFSR